jgi:DUF4097 and DUF4098 domain-containing protein YvlB
MTRARLSALALVPFLALTASADSVKEVRKTVPMDANGHLSIKTYKGSITITTADVKDAEIVARIEPDPDGEDQAEKVRQTEVRISGRGGSVDVESDYTEVERHQHHGIFGWFGGNNTLPLVNYTIRMPRTARLSIDDYKSRIKVGELAADLDLETYKGTATLGPLDGAVRINTYKGDVRAEFAAFRKDSRFETYKGEIELRLPRDSRFDLDADTGRRGDVDIDFDITTRSTSRRHSEELRGAVNGGGPRLKFETYKGSLRLKTR